MQIDTSLGSLDDAARAAAEHDGYDGYDGIFSGEVHNDAFLPLALAAAATEHITIGTAIAVAFSRSPMALAYTAHDLQRFSRGRLVIGLGSQIKAHVTRRFSMPWGRAAPQMRDFVLAMRAIWQSWADGSALDYESQHYRHTLMPPTFVPPPHDYGPPPILVAGVGDGMTRVAGEVADGFLCHAFTTERWIREHTLPALTDGRQRAGKTMDGFTVKAAVYLATGTDEQIAIAVENIRTQIAFYASTPAYKAVLDLHGWGDLGTELTELSKTGRWQEMGSLVDDDVLHAFAIVAPPDEVPARVAARCADVINRISFIANVFPIALVAALGDADEVRS
jgi:probable F420-dependent oxidoreductase